MLVLVSVGGKDFRLHWPQTMLLLRWLIYIYCVLIDSCNFFSHSWSFGSWSSCCWCMEYGITTGWLSSLSLPSTKTFASTSLKLVFFHLHFPSSSTSPSLPLPLPTFPSPPFPPPPRPSPPLPPPPLPPPPSLLLPSLPLSSYCIRLLNLYMYLVVLVCIPEWFLWATTLWTVDSRPIQCGEWIYIMLQCILPWAQCQCTCLQLLFPWPPPLTSPSVAVHSSLFL